MYYLVDLKKNAKHIVDAYRSGPALTVTFKQDDQVEFHADFTVALSCPKFPKCAQGRNNHSQKGLISIPGETCKPHTGIRRKIWTMMILCTTS